MKDNGTRTPLFELCTSYNCVLWLHILTSHLQTSVGCNNRSLIVDRCDGDENSARQTVLPNFCLIGHDGEVVIKCVAAIMDIGDVLTLHLETEKIHEVIEPQPDIM